MLLTIVILILQSKTSLQYKLFWSDFLLCQWLSNRRKLGFIARRTTTSFITSSTLCLDIFQGSQFENSCVYDKYFWVWLGCCKEIECSQKISCPVKTCKDFEAATASEVCPDQSLSSQAWRVNSRRRRRHAMVVASLNSRNPFPYRHSINAL